MPPSTSRLPTWSLPILVALVAVGIVRLVSLDWSLTGAKTYRRVALPGDVGQVYSEPDTTAVILNWSRFPNILNISSALCSESLDSVISQVFIWNNNPKPISYDDLSGTGCPRSKLRIYNSPENLYFQARFLACAQSETPYCFLQDDDYLVTPEVVYALHARIRDAQRPHTIHLLPPHEHLSSTLRETYVDGPVPIHTSFAWLGHGAILHRPKAIDFLTLMHSLNASDAELKMADNYYTLLSNRVPEIWFDQGIELGGGQPFTVGAEGEDRNKIHILKATDYLKALVAGNAALGTDVPYVWLGDSPSNPQSTTRAVCRSSSCLLETNIPLLPDGLVHNCTHPGCIFDVEIDNRGLLRGGAAQSYTDHGPSRAVDDRPQTYFESYRDAQTGEYVLLDYFRTHRRASGLRLVWLIDSGTARILGSSVLEVSCDGIDWRPLEHARICREVESSLPHLAGPGERELQECVLEWSPSDGLTAGGLDGVERFLRIRLEENVASHWKVFEVYLTMRP